MTSDPKTRTPIVDQTMQDDVISFLKSATGHPGGPDVEVVETHGAVIFLAGDVALKMKRAVCYDYMDLSTLDQREAMLRRELELNKPMAPDIYQNVVPVTRAGDGRLALDGDGAPVEWVLRMWRFPAAAELAVIAETKGIDDGLAGELGLAISRFHDQCPTRDTDGADLIKGILDELARVFSGMKDSLGSDLIDPFLAQSRAALAELSELLGQRGKLGHVRRCHGDLHLRNLVFLKGKVVLFDALEFDEFLGTCDVFYDLAFLIMDLRNRGFHRAANIALNAYLLAESGRQDEYLAVMPLFLSVRAAIKAMVHVQTMEATHRDPGPEPRNILREATQYLSPCPASLILVGGFSGTGKTTVSRAIAPIVGNAPGAVHLRSDEERKVMRGVRDLEKLNPGAYDPAARDAVYDRVFGRAETILGTGHSVLIDATFLNPDHRMRAARVAQNTNAQLQTLWLDAPVSVLTERVRNRSGDASDADENVVLQQVANPDLPRDWPVVAAGGSINDTIALAKSQLVLRRDS